MSKPIKMTSEIEASCRAAFEEALKVTKMMDGKMSFTKLFDIPDRKATVYFTGEAWAKVAMLVKEFDDEVAWHGVASRGEDESRDEYIISDIVVYPQAVSGATVEMDTAEYAKWIEENENDDRFNHIRMQGHSHVNIGTTPSAVDLTHQEEIVNQLFDDQFYIFMIFNKSFQINAKVFDLKKNILFENKDVTVKLIGGVEDLDKFIQDAKKMVKTKTYRYAPGGQYGGGYSGGYGRGYGYTPAASKPRAKIGAGWQGKQASLDDYDPYGYYER